MNISRKNVLVASLILIATVATPATSAFAYGLSSGVEAELVYSNEDEMTQPILRSHSDEPLELLSDVYKNLKGEERLPS